MSALSRMRVGMLAAGLSCLVIGNAWAEREAEREYEREGQSAQSQQNTSERSAGQIGQNTQEGQQYTAGFRGAQNAGKNQPVEHFLASCLLAKNEAEVELGQFAQQQAQNPEVKQFAQKLVEDHRQIIQQLQPLAGTQGARTSTSSGTRQIDAQRQAADTTRLPGSSGAGQPDRNVNQNANTNAATGQQHEAVNKLVQIERQIVDRHSQAVRDELQEKQGAEFDKCFVGGQVAGHMHMLAALEVIEQQGPDQLREVAQQARPKVQQHLEHAKELMKQLEGSSSASQAERQSSRTQR